MARNLIPSIRYADAPAAIDFLCNAFGFERHAVFADEADPKLIHHAQLVLDGGMIEAGGTTMTLYVYVPDPDAHCAQARAGGAEIIAEPHDNDGYPGRGYAARDSESHIWSFGSYDPWATE